MPLAEQVHNPPYKGACLTRAWPTIDKQWTVSPGRRGFPAVIVVVIDSGGFGYWRP